MLKTNQFADLHTHCPDGLDEGFEMIREIREGGIKDINLLAINYHEYPMDQNIRVLYYKKKITDVNLSAFGGLYHAPLIKTPFLEQAQNLLDMGCDGIKFIEEKPDYRKFVGVGLDDKSYDAMFDMLEEKQVPIVCHINDPEEYWDEEKIRKWPIGERLIELGWLYNDGTFLSYGEIFDETIRRLQKNPRLNICFAHFMFLSNRIEVAENLLQTYPNLKFDLTPGWEMYVGFAKNYENWRRFFETYSDRIFYGTDICSFPTNKAINETIRYAVGGEDKEIDIPHAKFARMRGFDLSEKAQKNICYNNFKAFIGTPKPVNQPLLIKEAERMLRLLKENNGEPGTIARLERMYADLKGE